MKAQVSLYGVFRDYDSTAAIELELHDGARIADLRVAMERYGAAHWPAFRPEMLRCCAFADATAVLRESDPLPADGHVAVLPPVSGG